jgi:Chaperone of endosialidase
MPFDSSGTFNRVRSWVSDAAASIKIRADYHDTHDSDLASGLSQCVTKDGRTQPTANIPMNQKRLINLGEPTAPTDGATKNYVDNLKTFATGVTIAGANFPNGMINFAAPTGITGLSFANANMSWVGKAAETGKWRGRLVADGPDGTGTELVTIDAGGFLGLNSGYLTHNLSNDGTNWRVNTTGTGTLFTMANGMFAIQSNDTVTVQNNQVATLDTFFTVTQSAITHDNSSTLGGNSSLLLQKKGSGNGCYLHGYLGSQVRWRIDLGNAAAESASWTGSDYYTYCWDNTGANAKPMFALTRSDNHAQFWGDVYSTTGTFRGNGAVAILSAQGGPCILRPYGADNATYQVYASTDGYFHLNCHSTIDAHTTYGTYAGLGLRGKNGIYGGWGGNWHNFLWANGYVYCLVDNSNVGAIQMVCDYRTKRNVAEIGSTWDAVKKLHPIKYQYKANPEMAGDEDDDEERWGFVAHELQKTLTKSAASFEKDVKNALQSPNLMVIVAALTKALQEAQTRIEALELKLAETL